MAEPRGSLWVMSTRTGVQLGLRLRLPHQLDPLTGRPLTCVLAGEATTEVRTWQRLTVEATEKRLQDRIRRLRMEHRGRLPDGRLDLRDLLVDAVVLLVPAGPAATELIVDDLEMASLVPAAATAEVERSRGQPPLQVRSGRAEIDGQPFFPIAVTDHGEPVEALVAAGVNLVWVPDYADRARTAALRRAGIGVMATPPRSLIDNRVASPDIAVPASFDEATEDVLLWMLGFRIPSWRYDEVRDSIGQVETSDRLFAQPRPIAADVTDRMRAFSRQLSVVGTTEQMLLTSRSPWDYFTSLTAAKSAALPGSLHMTWVPLEPSRRIVAARGPGRLVPVLEPEQVWMQTHLALAAGYRGLGYWNRSPLAGPQADATAEERRLTLTLAAMRLRLLEHWLATSTLQSSQPEPVMVGSVEGSDNEYAARSSVGKPHPNLMASILHSEEGMVVLPMWLPQQGQHCPGAMTARSTRMLIRGWYDARAWEVTTTGLRALELRRVAGGSEVVIGTIDQNALILLTSSTYLPRVQQLRNRIASLRSQASQTWIDLAQLKLDRTTAVDGDLKSLAVPTPRRTDARLLAARQHLDRARGSREGGDHDSARRYARQSMQELRLVQRAYWEAAVQTPTVGRPAAPTGSPHTVCFQTLPDHYRLQQRLRDAPLGPPLALAGHDRDLPTDAVDRPLPGGQFEDLAEMEEAGWQPRPVDRDDIAAHGELAPVVQRVARITQTSQTEPQTEPRAGRCLRLVARPATALVEGQAKPTGRTLVVESPAVAIAAGEAVRLTCRLRVQPGTWGLVYDSIGGPLLAVPVAGDGQWQTVSLLRESPADDWLTFTFELHGCGEMCLDDVRVRRARLAAAEPEGVEPASPVASPEEAKPFRLVPDFPKLPLWSREEE